MHKTVCPIREPRGDCLPPKGKVTILNGHGIGTDDFLENFLQSSGVLLMPW